VLTRRSPGGATDEVELIINLKAAKQIGLTIPERAGAGGQGDQIIEEHEAVMPGLN
jgi:hypothetical protein